MAKANDNSIQISLEMPRIGGDDVEASKSFDSRDIADLTRTGKKPVLKRNFGFMSILGFSCLVVCTWGGSFSLLGVALKNGGPAGTIYSFIIVWIGNLATFSSLAELASMAPTAGGQYHWASILAPPSCQKVFSYITGWLTVVGWQASVAASAFVSGTLIQGFIELVNPNYSPRLWHAILLLYGALALSVFTTTVAGTVLPKIESMMLVIYILGFFGVIVPLVYLGPHGNAHDVFATFLNEGGWSSQGLSFFVGADSVYHMSEEIHNAAIVVPRSIIWSILINGVVGLSMYIAILFSIGDVQAALNSNCVYPFIEVLVQAIRSIAGSAVILAILIIVDLTLVIGTVAASSRMLWSFARDRGIPGWRQISRVDKKTSIPMIAVATTTVFSLLIGLISIGSPIAFNDVISLTVSGLYASCFVACIFLLWRRCEGSIKEESQLAALNDRPRNTNLPGAAGNLIWGPWRIPEPFGTAVNAFACVYLLIVFLFTFWPPATPVTSITMNYSSLVIGFVAIISALYYVLRANKIYTGPVVDIGPNY